MDFMNRGGRPVQQNTQTQTNGPAHGLDGGPSSPKGPAPKSAKLTDKSKIARAIYVGFLGMVTVLFLAVIILIALSKDAGSKEAGYVADDKFQAVFLNGGQVYFGNITDLNSQHLRMQNIYYLRVNQQVQPDQQQKAAAANDISLVKLGCELHGPEDSMVINREQVIFWENLKQDGQVAKAVEEYIKANPDGQNCEQQNNAGGGANNGAPAPTNAAPPAATPPAATPRPATPAPAGR